jgi:hypothetical protein
MMAKRIVAKIEIGVWIWIVIRVVVAIIGVRIIIWFRRGLLLGGGLSPSILALDIRNEILKHLNCLFLFHR